jgi:DNA repair photolyase
VKQLSRAGISVGVNAMPILPGLNDSDKCLDTLAQAARRAGARFLYGNILFLTPSAMKQFMPFLQEEFPRLARHYRKLYAHSAYLNGDYKNRMARLLAELRVRYGLEGNQGETPPAARHPQLALPFEALGHDATPSKLLTPCS